LLFSGDFRAAELDPGAVKSAKDANPTIVKTTVNGRNRRA
jgi:hypothetical protein